MAIHANINYKKREKRTRAKILKRRKYLRLSVYRSNNYTYAQIIDDNKNQTIISYSDSKLNIAKGKKLTKSEKAFMVGKNLADLARKKKISKVVFDRGGYRYHGRVKAVADGAREGGLSF